MDSFFCSWFVPLFGIDNWGRNSEITNLYRTWIVVVEEGDLNLPFLYEDVKLMPRVVRHSRERKNIKILKPFRIG